MATPSTGVPLSTALPEAGLAGPDTSSKSERRASKLRCASPKRFGEAKRSAATGSSAENPVSSASASSFSTCALRRTRMRRNGFSALLRFSPATRRVPGSLQRIRSQQGVSLLRTSSEMRSDAWTRVALTSSSCRGRRVRPPAAQWRGGRLSTAAPRARHSEAGAAGAILGGCAAGAVLGGCAAGAILGGCAAAALSTPLENGRGENTSCATSSSRFAALEAARAAAAAEASATDFG